MLWYFIVHSTLLYVYCILFHVIIYLYIKNTFFPKKKILEGLDELPKNNKINQNRYIKKMLGTGMVPCHYP